MTNAADLKGSIYPIAEIRGISQQQRFGKGCSVIRKGSRNVVNRRLFCSSRKKQEAIPIRFVRQLRCFLGSNQKLSVSTVVGRILSSGRGGQAKAELPFQHCPRHNWGSLFGINRQKIWLPVKEGHCLHTASVFCFLAVIRGCHRKRNRHTVHWL